MAENKISSNGLDITEDEFCKMKLKDQNLILFRNIVHIRKKFADYAITKKFQYVWLSVLTAVMLGWFGIKARLGL